MMLLVRRFWRRLDQLVQLGLARFGNAFRIQPRSFGPGLFSF